MKKHLKKLALVFAVLLVAFLGYAASRPNTFRVERSASINARPERIYALINDFRNWQKWSPWERLDPTMSRTISGAARGKGAVYEWSGQGQVGAGRMEITGATPFRHISIQLDFIKPFEASSTVDFVLEKKGEATNVTWVMSGRNRFFEKVMTIFCDMDQMIGKDYETGLANLKSIAEK